MRKMNSILLCCVAISLLLGCANAIYFYETEKVSLTLEARPDPSQPVSGNVGIKQRVVVVTPPKQASDTLQPESEAVSMISKFDLTSKDEPGWNTVIIESTLLTGDAANFKNSQAAQKAFAAISGVSEFKKHTNKYTDIRDILVHYRALNGTNKAAFVVNLNALQKGDADVNDEGSIKINLHGLSDKNRLKALNTVKKLYDQEHK